MRFPGLMYREGISLSKTRNWWWFIDRICDYEAHMHAIRRTIVTEQTEFQEVGLMETALYGKLLLLDGDMQSSQADEFIYHEALVHPAMTSHPSPEEVLILGGGEGATLREVLRHKTVKKVIMIDIDRRLVEICKEYMPEWSQGSFSDPRLTLLHADACTWVEESKALFDVIICDLTEPLPYTPSTGIFSVEFFEQIKRRLKKAGIFAMQASKGDMLNMMNHSANYKTLTEVFPLVRSYLARIPSFDYMWSYAFASETIDPVAIPAEDIDRTIAERLESELRFYDGETHRGIFSLPRYFRTQRLTYERILQKGEVLQIKEPSYLI
jgi:spermidine synthase